MTLFRKITGPETNHSLFELSVHGVGVPFVIRVFLFRSYVVLTSQCAQKAKKKSSFLFEMYSILLHIPQILQRNEIKQDRIIIFMQLFCWYFLGIVVIWEKVGASFYSNHQTLCKYFHTYLCNSPPKGSKWLAEGLHYTWSSTKGGVHNQVPPRADWILICLGLRGCLVSSQLPGSIPRSCSVSVDPA